jgi:hypothetical protein
MVPKKYEDRCGEEARLAYLQSSGPVHPNGVGSLLLKAFYFPVSRDHGPHAAGLEAQQPGDNEVARGDLGEKHSEGYRLRAATRVPDREDGGQLHRKPL